MSFIEGEITVEFGGTVGPAGPAGNAIPIAAGTTLANNTGALANPVGVDAAGMRTLIGVVFGTTASTFCQGNDSRLVKLDPATSSMAIASAGLGNWNTVSVGYNALQAATNVSDSTYVGTSSGRYMEDGNGNTALGNLTQATIVEGDHNTTVGDASGRYLENGSGNTFLGYVSATEWVNGDWNVVLGSYAGAYNSDGSFNILIGGYAGAQSNPGTTHLGDHNIGIGYDSLKTAEGNHVIGIGHESAYAAKGDNIISIGRQSGASITSVNAEDCVFIGRRAGNAAGVQKADAVNVICIGTEAVTTADNSVVIGNTSIASTTLRGKITGVSGLFLDGQTVSGASSGTSVGIHNAGDGLLLVAGATQGFRVHNAANTTELFRIANSGAATLVGSLNANAVGENIRIRANGTNLDGALVCGGTGDLYLGNWALERGIKISSDGSFSTLGSGTTNLGGPFISTPVSSTTLSTNGTMVFDIVSNTELRVKLRGTDGVTRSTILTLSPP